MVHSPTSSGKFCISKPTRIWRLVVGLSNSSLASGKSRTLHLQRAALKILTSSSHYSDDNTLPADSILATCTELFVNCCAKTGKHIDTEATFKSRIEAAGFTNIHERIYKVPIGDWAKTPLLKDAGQFHQAQLLEGAEGVRILSSSNEDDANPGKVFHVPPYPLWRAYTMDARRGSGLLGEIQERGEGSIDACLSTHEKGVGTEALRQDGGERIEGRG